MYKYTLAVTSPEYWNTIHNALIVDSNEDGIPDRKVTCSDTKEHSPTRGTYWLTDEEAMEYQHILKLSGLNYHHLIIVIHIQNQNQIQKDFVKM